MADGFEKTLRSEVKAIAERLEVDESKAFAIWYGKVVLRLEEEEAREAASYDGGNDRGTDFFFVDDEWDRVIIAQWKYYEKSSKTPPASEVTALLNVPNELEDPQDLRDDGRADLAEAAEALTEARDRGYSLELRFFYPGKKNADRDRDPNRVVRNFNRRNRGDNMTAQLVRLEDLQVAYEDYQGSADRVQSGELEIDGEYLEEDGAWGKSYVGTVTGASLAQLYADHGNRLFDQNVRLFLGVRKGTVNAGIADTLESPEERGNFWAYNNGITVVARGVEPTEEGLSLTDFSIVNGCQTTVSIAEASKAAAGNVGVVARVIAAEEPALIEKIIRYTNSQTPINVWDISARDKVQQRLRKDLDELDDPWFYSLRRGEFQTLDDKKRYGKHGGRRLLPFPEAAQYLAAFRGMPVEAYKEKALLFTSHKAQVFPPDTSAADLLWAWVVGQAADVAIPEMREQFPDDELAQAILKRGARFFVLAIAAQLLREQNGIDFVEKVGTSGLQTKAMGERLTKYSKLAALYYVQIMKTVVSSAADVGTQIRRPETAERIALGVNERLVGERLAPDALKEKLPKLPGVTK